MNPNAASLLIIAACCFSIAYLFKPTKAKLSPTECKLTPEYKYKTTNPLSVYHILLERDKNEQKLPG